MYEYRDKVLAWLTQQGYNVQKHYDISFASNFAIDIPDDEAAIQFKFEFAHYYIIEREEC